MLEAHRVRNGNNEWNRLPAGYVNLENGDKIQPGDVIRVSDDYFCEYNTGLLLGTYCGCTHVWFRKKAVEAPQSEAA